MTESGRFKRVQERFGEQVFELEIFADLDAEINRICENSEKMSSEEVSRALDLSPYFGVVWPSARGLSRYLFEKAALRTGTRVLELGCGLALPSFVAARLGAQVVATDFHPEVRVFIEKNSALNGVTVEYREQDWRDLDLPQERFEVVMASDVLYEKEHPRDLVAGVLRWVEPNGRVFLADPGRIYLQSAVDEFERQGWRGILYPFQVANTQGIAQIDRAPQKEIFVFEFNAR